MDSTVKPSREHRRSKTGCQPCRTKRKKCDETRPRCQRCSRAGQVCKWPTSVRFRHQKIPGVDAVVLSDTGEDFAEPLEVEDDEGVTRVDNTDLEECGPSAAIGTVTEHPSHDRTLTAPSTSTAPRLSNVTITPQTWPNILSHPQTQQSAARHSFGDVRPRSAYISPQLTSQTSVVCSPDVLTDDGIFLPGSTYQELHQALRTQIFQTAQSQPNSRRATPAPDAAGDSTIDENQQDVLSTGSSTPPELTTGQEVLLWDNWINEIGPWLDKFDHGKHHQHTLPAMAQTIPHLKYSMLALSARQLERKSKSLPHATSLGLYQWAIHLLLPVLHTRSIPILASCVVLCVFEMLSCSPKAWRRHLDGCASLIMSMDIRGDQGGLEQALFWCFARMDVCGGLISAERTLIPVSKWYSTDTTPGTMMGPPIVHFEDHACYGCSLLAHVLQLLNHSSSEGRRHRSDSTFIASWIRLFDALTAWQRAVPPEMKPILYLSSTPDNPSQPFPTVIFSNGAAISGNQLYHTAMLLMLQAKPPGLSTESRSILWHARQICAISISNSHHGAWTNSVQPLWLAGQLMSSPNEHRAIVELYARIERETGWGATWRAEDLKLHWGDLT